MLSDRIRVENGGDERAKDSSAPEHQLLLEELFQNNCILTILESPQSPWCPLSGHDLLQLRDLWPHPTHGDPQHQAGDSLAHSEATE